MLIYAELFRVDSHPNGFAGWKMSNGIKFHGVLNNLFSKLDKLTEVLNFWLLLKKLCRRSGLCPWGFSLNYRVGCYLKVVNQFQHK